MSPNTGAVPALVCDEVTFTYPGRESYPAIHGMTLEIRKGEFVAVAGSNGSGKSTLCRLFNALILPQKGRAISCGLETALPENLAEIRRRVGLIMQNPDNQIVGPTVEDDVAFGLENMGLSREEMRPRVEWAMGAMDLTGLRGREPDLLSIGERKRLAVAGVLVTKPQVIVSDESTSMLDPGGRAEIIALFRRLRDEMGLTVVHATHSADEMLAADRMLLLERGRLLYDGSPSGLFREPELAGGQDLEAPPLLELLYELENRGFALAGTPLEVEEVAERLWASS